MWLSWARFVAVLAIPVVMAGCAGSASKPIAGSPRVPASLSATALPPSPTATTTPGPASATSTATPTRVPPTSTPVPPPTATPTPPARTKPGSGPGSLTPRTWEANLSVSPEEIGPGERFTVEVSLRALTETLNVGHYTPTVSVNASDSERYHTSLPIPQWISLTLAPGNSVTRTITFDPLPAPGWYWIHFGFEYLTGYYQNQSRYQSAGLERRLFVRYPPGGTREGTLTLNQSVAHDSFTVTLETLVMTPRETVVTYTVSSARPSTRSLSRSEAYLFTVDWPPMPMPFDRPALANLRDPQHYWYLPGGELRAETNFEPVPVALKRIFFEVLEIGEVTAAGVVTHRGPWRIEVNLGP